MKQRNFLPNLFLALSLGAAVAAIIWAATGAFMPPAECVKPTVEPTPAAVPTITLSPGLAEELDGVEPQEVPTEVVEFLAEEGQAGRDWSKCRWYISDTSYVICRDGYVASS